MRSIDAHATPRPSVTGEAELIAMDEHVRKLIPQIRCLPAGPEGRRLLATTYGDAIAAMREGLPDQVCADYLGMAPELHLDRDDDATFCFVAIRIREWLESLHQSIPMAIATRRSIRAGTR